MNLQKNRNVLSLVSLILFLVPVFEAHALYRKGSNKFKTVSSFSQRQAGLMLLASHSASSDDVAAPFNAFPNLHMLFVHFPAVLLIIALIFQILSFFIYKQGMDVTTFILLGLGWLGAILAAFVFHPHVADLPEQAQKVFEAHEMYAYWTVGLSTTALILKTMTFFFFRGKQWMKVLTLLVMAAAVYTLAGAGHLGSQLVYIEGVGPKGQYIEQHHGSEQH